MNKIDPNSNQSVSYRQKGHKTFFRITQVALWILIAAGVTVALLAHYSYIDHKYIYHGAIGAASSFVIVTLFTIFFKNELKHALRGASLEELEEIMKDATIHYPECCTFNNCGCATACATCIGTIDDDQITSPHFVGHISSREFESIFSYRKRRATSEKEISCTKRISEFVNQRYEDIKSNSSI